jgi:hypothetical protein
MIHIRVADSANTLCGTVVLQLSPEDAILPVDRDEFVTSRKGRTILPPTVWKLLPKDQACRACIEIWLVPQKT